MPPTTCHKRPYRTLVDAQIALASVDLSAKRSSKQAQRRGEYRIYRCPRCGRFHLSSKTRGRV